MLDQARKHHRYRLTRPRTVWLDCAGRDDPAAIVPVGADLDLARALRTLTMRQRQTITLFYFLDLPISEVAQIMRCTPGTIKSTLADARTRLRAALADET